MFAKGDLIIYGSTGVCRIEEIGRPAGLSGVPEGKQYYTLSPVYSDGVIYAPLDTPVQMRRVITADEANRLIDSIPSIPCENCTSRDPKYLNGFYRTFFEDGSCEGLLKLIKILYVRIQNAAASGKKPGQVDQRTIRRAEELLHGELAAALDIPMDGVPDYIAGRIAVN